MAAQESTAIRKRQQIANANRMMFMWVAGVSAVVGIALVASVFLFQKALFNEKVLTEKSKTASTLVNNNKVVDELKNQVRVLNTNDALKSAMAPGESQPIQVVLDALPSEANSSAFGASLQKKFLNADGLQLDALSVDPVIGVESQSTTGVQDASKSSSSVSQNQITFSFTVSTDVSNANALKSLLTNLEHSIRPIDISSLSVEAQGVRLVLKVEGATYYEPAKTVDLKDKTVKP
jgi:hypothetical protein